MYYISYIFLLPCFNRIQHSVWRVWLLQSPHCQIRETTNYQAYTCVYLYPWAHSLVHAWTVGSTECGHSGLKCTPRRAPASRLIVVFICNIYLTSFYVGVLPGLPLASFPGPARSSLAVRNSRRGRWPGLVHHVMSAPVVFLRHQIAMFAVLPMYKEVSSWNKSNAYDRL